MRIMIVDDDAGITSTTQAVLESAGHVVSARTSALGTMRSILDERPDLVLLDIAMPSLSGTGLADIVRRRAADTIVVLFSGRSDDELESLARECGAHGWVCKGTPPRALLDYIERFVG